MVFLEANVWLMKLALHLDQTLASSKAQIPFSRRISFESDIYVLHADYI